MSAVPLPSCCPQFAADLPTGAVAVGLLSSPCCGCCAPPRTSRIDSPLCSYYGFGQGVLNYKCKEDGRGTIKQVHARCNTHRACARRPRRRRRHRPFRPRRCCCCWRCWRCCWRSCCCCLPFLPCHVPSLVLGAGGSGPVKGPVHRSVSGTIALLIMPRQLRASCQLPAPFPRRQLLASSRHFWLCGAVQQRALRRIAVEA